MWGSKISYLLMHLTNIYGKTEFNDELQSIVKAKNIIIQITTCIRISASEELF